MGTIRNDISIQAMNRTMQLEAESIRTHFEKLGCDNIKLNVFIKLWYESFRKFKKDTLDDIWSRFVDDRMNKLNGLENINMNRVRIYFERPEERKNVNKSTRRFLANMMLLDCGIKKCSECDADTVLKYSRYFETIYAKCLKCGKKYKNI